MSTEQIKVLLIGGKPKDARSIIKKLSDAKDADFDVEPVESVPAGIERLAQNEIDVVLLDLSLSNDQGLDSFTTVPEQALSVPIIVLADPSDKDLALEAIRHGAQDHLVKNQIDEKILSRAIRNAIERQRHDLTLRETEGRYRALLDSAPDPIVIIGNDGTIRACSAATGTFSGLSREELEGKSFTELAVLDSEDLPKFMEYFEHLQQGQNLEGFELQIKHKDGSPRWASVKASAVESGQGPAEILVIARDITDCRQAEQDLSTKESYYRRLIENVPEGIVLLDSDGTMHYYSESLKYVLGYEEGENIGKSVFEFVHSDDKEGAVDVFRKLVSNPGGTDTQEVRALHKDGSWHDVEVTGTNYLHDPAVRGIVINFHDVTKYKHAEQALREAESRYRAIFDNPLNMVFIYDEQGTILDANESAIRRFGYSTEDLGKVRFQDVLHPEDLPAAQESVAQLLANERSNPLRVRAFSKASGEVIWVEVYGYLLEQDGEHFKALAIARDITERKRVEEERRESEQRYRLLADNVTDIIWTADLSLRLTYVSPSVERQAGYTVEEAMAMTFDQFLTPESFELAASVLAEELSIENTENRNLLRSRAVQTEFVNKDGSHFWAETTVSFLRGPDKEAIGVLGLTRDITDRRQAHEALQQSEDRFRTLIDNSSDVISIVEPDGTIRYQSPSLETMLGYRPEELEGTNMFLLLHPEEQEGTIQRFSDFASEPGSTASSIQRLRHKDGSWRTVEVISTNLLSDPNIQGIVANWNDITDRLEAAENLRNREAYFRRLIEHGTDGIVVLDALGTMLHYSPSFKRILGYEEWENIGKSVFDLVHPDDVPAAVNKFAGLLPTPGSTDVVEVRARHKTGSWRLLEVFGANYLHDPAVGGIVLNLRDITELEEAEETLRQSEKRFRTLIEYSSDVITITTKDGTIQYESPSVERVMGYKPEELIGKNVYEFLHPDDQLNASQGLEDFLSDPGAVVTTIQRSRHKDGSWRTIEVASTNLLEDPVIQGIIANSRDITGRKEAEESLARYAAELTRSNAELEQFAFVASHDLKEPLRMVRVYVQLLAKRYAGKLDADADEFIDYAVDGAGRMHALIEGLLAYSRVGAPDTKFEPVNLEAALDQAIANLQMAVDENEAQISHDPLPTVMGDESQLRQLFQNLISDAIRFRAEEPPQIRISVEQKDQEWLFSVQDNGIGFEQEYGERIFVIFKRLHVKEKYPGTGIGLTLCRKIVECHGGQMWAESELGQGATFYFTIPVSGGTQS